jgi:hypothetical protein
MNFKRTFSANTSAQNIATETSISSSNLRLPLTFCANMGATRTPKGLSTFGHGWMQGVNKNGQSFSMGAYLDGMQYEDDKTSFCKRTRHFTVYVSTEQQNQAIRAMNRDHWTSWDNCIDHVVDALIAIEYPLPNGKNSFVKLASRISCPYLFRSWIEKQEGNIPSDFLPNANDRIMPYNFPWTR